MKDEVEKILRANINLAIERGKQPQGDRSPYTAEAVSALLAIIQKAQVEAVRAELTRLAQSTHMLQDGSYGIASTELGYRLGDLEGLANLDRLASLKEDGETE